MRTLRFRVTGPEQAFGAMMATLTGLDHVDRVEEIGDLMSGMRDDSSSADLVDDDRGNSHDIEVHATSDRGVELGGGGFLGLDQLPRISAGRFGNIFQVRKAVIKYQ